MGDNYGTYAFSKDGEQQIVTGRWHRDGYFVTLSGHTYGLGYLVRTRQPH